MKQGEITIELKQLRFFAFHGLYKKEKELGGQFEVNLAVSFYSGINIIKSIKKTINYELLFDLLKSEMQTPRDLLETLAMELAEKINKQFRKSEPLWIDKKYLLRNTSFYLIDDEVLFDEANNTIATNNEEKFNYYRSRLETYLYH